MHPSRLPTRPLAASDRQIAAALALLLLAVYLTTADLRFQSIDEVAVFSVARSLVGHGGVETDGLFWTRIFTGAGSVVAPGADGHMYSLKDPGMSLLAVPLVSLAYRLGFSPVRTAFLLSPLLTALTGALLYLAARSLGYRRRASVLGALTFGLATMAWPYAETLFTQPLAALGLLLGTWLAAHAHTRAEWRLALAAGLGLGLATTAAISLWVLLPAYGLFLVPWEHAARHDWRSAVRRALPLLIVFGAGAGLFAAGEGAYNAIRFGSPLVTGHTETSGLAFSLQTFVLGSVGQLVSLPRGVIWYAPAVLLAPVGAGLMWRRDQRRLVLFITAQSALLFALYSSWFDWGGGLAWGPRFLVSLMPLLALLAVPLYERLLDGAPLWATALTGVLLVLSIAVQLAAALTDVAYSQRDIFLRLTDATGQFGTARWSVLLDPSTLPLVRLTGLLREGRWGVLWLSRGSLDVPLVLGLLALVGLAGVWLALAPLRPLQVGRRRAGGASTQHAAGSLLTVGLLVQGVATIMLAALMLHRYPHAPNGYLSAEAPRPDALSEVTAALSARAAPGDGIVLLMPEDYISWLDGYRSQVPEMNFFVQAPLDQQSAEMLASARELYDRVWLVSTGTMRGNWSNGVELWLARSACIGEVLVETPSLSLLSYTFPVDMPPMEPASVHFGNGEVRLAGYAWEIVRRPDAAWMNVHLQWEAVSAPPADYTVTVQLWTLDWAKLAQHDGQPLAAFAPTSTWEPGAVIDDRHSLSLPPDLSPGEYYLHIGLYDLTTGEVVWPQEVPEHLWIPIEIPPPG